MSRPGIGVMLYALGGGNDTPAERFYGHKVVGATIDNDEFVLTFEDGTKLSLTDEGQSCCESRYITCDDDIGALVGGTLRKIEVTGEDEEPAEYDSHDVCFVEVATDQAHVKLVTHVEHNGYYGGFALKLTAVPA